MKKILFPILILLNAFFMLSCSFTRHETDLLIIFNLYDGSDNYICSINEEGGDFKKIAGPFQAITNPVCSPDGLRIAFTKDVTIGPDTYGQIWTMNSDGSDMKQETAPGTGIHHLHPTWSTDARYIYYVSYDDAFGLNYSALYKLDTEDGTVTANSSQSFYNGCPVAWNQDYIAFFDYALNSISVLDPGTAYPYTIIFTSAVASLSSPTFFYDGRLAGSFGSSIYIYKSDFSSYTTISFSSQGLTPGYFTVSPSGKKLVFVDSGSGSLWIYDLEQGGNAVLLKTGNCTTPNYMGKPR
jgi:Tol biopolymer transport system component